MEKSNFEKYVMPEPMSGCWLWSGGIKCNRTGYGGFKSKAAHRVSYEIYKGKIPKGLYVLHNCDNRLCVNPDHLFLGTHQSNVIDMYSKGRGLKTRNRLTIDQADQVRLKFKKGISKKEIALEFKVSDTTITRILKNKTFTA